MMSAMDRVPRRALSGRFLPLAAAVALAASQAGCATWDALGWKRPFGPSQPAPAFDPAQDSYAATAAASRSRQDQQPPPAHHDHQPSANPASPAASKPVEESSHSSPPPLEDPSAGEGPSLEGPVTSARRSRSTRPSTMDSGVKVTLGRPESLPTLRDGEPIVASAGKDPGRTSWRASQPARKPEAKAENDAIAANTPAPANNEPLAARDDAPAAGADTLAARDDAPAARDDTPVASDDGGPIVLADAAPPKRPTPSPKARLASRSSAMQDEPEELADLAPRAPAAQPAPRASGGQEGLKEILDAAKDRLDAMSTYQVNLAREEMVGGQVQSEKDVVLSIRRKPAAARLVWVGGPSKGREVIYSKALNDRMMYVNLNNGMPLSRMSIPVDSPLALRNSRHPISEAGFDTIFAKLFPYRDASPSTARDGKLVLKGTATPEGFGAPCHLLERTTPSGEVWRVYLDKKTLMPAVVLAQKAGSGELIEKYTYRDLKENPGELAAVEAFDPDKRWGESKGFFSRLAGGAGSGNADKTGSTTRR